MKRLVSSTPLRWGLLTFLLSLPAALPALLHPVGEYAYDAATAHIYRSVVYSQAISDGALYPRWVQFLHLGLGSPLFTFQGPLPYYALDFLYRLGIPQPIGWRILMAGGLLVASSGAGLLVWALTRQRFAALLSAMAYLYAPYLLRNLYERGTLESFSTLLYPWVLWGLVWLAQRPSGRRFAVATALWALCVGAHVLGPLLLAPFAAALALYLWRREHNWLPLAALLAGGLLMAWIWLPMAAEQRWVQVHRDFGNVTALPSVNSIRWNDLLALPAVYDSAAGNNNTGDRVGLLQSLLLVMGLPSAVWAWRRRHPAALALVVTSSCGIVLLALMTPLADPVWKALAPMLDRLQYRSRFLGIEALAAAMTAGYLVTLLSPRVRLAVVGSLAGLLILAATPSLYVELRHRYAPLGNQITMAQVRAAELKSGGSAFTEFNEFLPLPRTDPLDERFRNEYGPVLDPGVAPVHNPSSQLTVRAAQVKQSQWDVTVEAGRAMSVTLNTLYYPRWQGSVDGTRTIVGAETGSGLAQVSVPAGTHRILLDYGITGAETAGFGIALVTLLAISGGWLWSKRRTPASARPFDIVVEDEGAPAWRLIAIIAVIVLLKAAVLDPATGWFRCHSSLTYVCGASSAVAVTFPQAPTLRGYHVSTSTPTRGGQLFVSLFWERDGDMARPKQSFVHLRNREKNWPLKPGNTSDIWSQADHLTPGGLFTNEYMPDRIYRDDFAIDVPVEMPPGPYNLEIGWYDPATSEQLDPVGTSVTAPLSVLWRSVLLPQVAVK